MRVWSYAQGGKGAEPSLKADNRFRYVPHHHSGIISLGYQPGTDSEQCSLCT